MRAVFLACGTRLPAETDECLQTANDRNGTHPGSDSPQQEKLPAYCLGEGGDSGWVIGSLYDSKTSFFGFYAEK